MPTKDIEPGQIPAPPDGIWTLNYIRELVEQGIMQTEMILPDETIPISWNGVTIYVTKGIRIEVPKVHADIYWQSREATQQAYQNSVETLNKRAFGPGQTVVESGWNGNR